MHSHSRHYLVLDLIMRDLDPVNISGPSNIHHHEVIHGENKVKETDTEELPRVCPLHISSL